MKRIGIMGGTFNPIHNGHLAIAGQAKEQFLLDKVLFMPSGVSYMKNQQEILPACVRCEMTALAIRDIPGYEHLHQSYAAKAESPASRNELLLYSWRGQPVRPRDLAMPGTHFPELHHTGGGEEKAGFYRPFHAGYEGTAAGAVTVSSAKISCFCRNTGYRQHRRFLFPDPRSPAKERDDTRPCTRGGGGLYYQKSAVSKLINKKI